MRKILFLITLFGAWLVADGVQAQQRRVEARIAGLEQDSTYMSLLHEDARLQEREDSIASAVVQLRRELRANPGNRAE